MVENKLTSRATRASLANHSQVPLGPANAGRMTFSDLFSPFLALRQVETWRAALIHLRLRSNLVDVFAGETTLDLDYLARGISCDLGPFIILHHFA